MRGTSFSYELLLLLIVILLVTSAVVTYIYRYTEKVQTIPKMSTEEESTRHPILLVTDNIDTAYLFSQYSNLYVTILSSTKFVNSTISYDDYELIYVLNVNTTLVHEKVKNLIQLGYHLVIDSTALTPSEFFNIFEGTMGRTITLSGTYKIYRESGCGYICTKLPERVYIDRISLKEVTCRTPLFRFGTHIIMCKYLNTYFISIDTSTLLDENDILKKVPVLVLS